MLRASREKGAMMNELHAKRLRAAGHTIPVPITFLHGWNLQASTRIVQEVRATQLFRFHEPHIRGTSPRTMYMTRYGLYLIVAVVPFLYYLYHGHYKLLLLMPLFLWYFKYCERKSVFRVFDEDMDTAARSIRDEPTEILVGYNYGGALATYLLHHR